MSAQPGPSESANASAPSLPQKRYFRQRAHVNVLADHALDYPRTPRQGNWAAELFPHFIQATPPPPPTASAAKKRASEGQGTESSANVKRPRVDNEVEGAGAPMDVDIQEPDSAPNTTEEFEGDGIEYFEEPTTEGTATDVKRIEFADIGCGYGGLLIELSPLFPDTLMLGMEIRTKVTAYVEERIKALRAQAKEQGKIAYENIAVVRGNAMKYMANFFEKGQLKKIFFLYPDPNFKRRTLSRRIISPNLLSEYAYGLAIGGLLYTCTDVLALHEWMVGRLENHPLFERLPEEEVERDPCRAAVWGGTEEGKKVERNGGGKWMSIWRRIEA